MSIARVIKKFLLEIIRETMMSGNASYFHKPADCFINWKKMYNNKCLLDEQERLIRCTRTDLIYNL